MLIIILAIIFAMWGVYVNIPNRGITGVIASVVITASFFSFVYLTKLIIMM